MTRVLVVTNVLEPPTWAVWEAAAGVVDLHLVASAQVHQLEVFRSEPEQPAFAPSTLLRTRDLAGGRGQIWWHYDGLRRLVRQVRPDVVHVHAECWSVVAGQALGLPVPVVLHGADNLFRHGRRVEDAVRLRLARRNLKRADAYVSWNARGLALARQHGLPSSTLGLVVPAVVPQPLPQATLPDSGRIGFLGRLDHQKGIDRLLMAAAVAGLPVAIAGAGPGEGALRRVAEGLGVDVDWSGLCAPGDVPAYLASIDVLVVPEPDPRARRRAVRARRRGGDVGRHARRRQRQRGAP